MNLKVSREIVNIFIVGCLLRLVLMPFLFHPDLKTQYFHAHFLGQGVFNIYQFIAKNKANLGYTDTFNYPPLTYYILGSWNIVVSPILGNSYDEWLNNWGVNGFTNDQIFRELFFLKIPYLVADLLSGFFIYKILDQKYRKTGLLLWLFNPISLYLIYGLSNFDIIPTFSTLLSLYLFKEKKYFYSGLSLSFGIATKLFPAMFLPFFIIYLLKERNIKAAINFIFGSILIFLISIIFLVRDFLNISQSGLTSKIFEFYISVGTLHLPIFIIVYLLLIILCLKQLNSFNRLNISILITALLVLIFSQFHPQWMIWGFPFLIIFLVRNLKHIWILVLLFISLLLMALSFNDKYLTLGIFSPIIPQIYSIDTIELTVLSRVSEIFLIFLSHFILVLITGFIFLKGVFKWKES